MKAMDDLDGILKELGELYEFNREIRRFEFLKNAPYEANATALVVAEDSPEYKTGKD